MSNAAVLSYSYRQIAVFRASLPDPFNDWTARHTAQGFSWRDGSVSFSTLDDGGRAEIEVKRQQGFIPDPAAERVIVVPFEVDHTGIVECGSIGQSFEVEVSPGKYALYYETGRKDAEVVWVRFCFVPQESIQPRVLRADAELAPRYPLVMDAAPAA